MLITAETYLIRVRVKDGLALKQIIVDENTANASLNDVALTFEMKSIQDFTLTMNATIAQLDFDKIAFPLVWRRWREGDNFVPFGMHHSKKISDFLIDIKMPLFDKDTATVIESGSNIIWLVGHRIDDRFKVTSQTKRVFIIS